jgi:tRNA(Ile)-lysidine synthase TilS/MesJ
MKICEKCVLPESFPGIIFNEDGICQYCANHKGNENLKNQKKIFLNKFLGVFEKIQGKNIYDGILAYSGGKDSTYTLSILNEQFNLNILAVTFDNWFQSESAYQNVKTVLSHLNADHLTIRPNYELLKRIFRAVSENSIYSSKTIERASTICTTCLSMIRFSCFRLAIEKEIPLIFFGLSPGQAAVNTSVFKTNPALLQGMQNAIYQPLLSTIGDDINPYFLEEKQFQKTNSYPYNINLLAFWEYNEDQIYEKIKQYGWQSPKDTDSNSTNCLLNAYANWIHKKQYNFHPYAFELAELVRKEHLTRDDALAKLSIEEDPNMIEMVAQKLFS